MQPIDRWAHGTQLLKLLNEMDQCRIELDQAVARADTQLADQLLKKFRDLASAVDQLAEVENTKHPTPNQHDEQRLTSEA